MSILIDRVQLMNISADIEPLCMHTGRKGGTMKHKTGVSYGNISDGFFA